MAFPIDPFLAGGDVDPVVGAAERFLDGLMRWRPQATRTGLQRPPRVVVRCADESAFMAEANRLFLTNLWGDGLPLYPPTEGRIEWVLRGSDRPRGTSLGKVLPRGGIATVETVAIALAMAGGRPEYLPVLVAAVEALLDPAIEHDKSQANSGSPFPVVIVNGPVAAAIRLNDGFGLMGPDPQHPAGGAIGRALRLILQNVGGALPGVGTMAAYAGMRYTNAVFAEKEASLPGSWPTVGDDHWGLPRGRNGVTLFFANGAVNILRRAVSAGDLSAELTNGLRRTAAYLRLPNPDYTFGWTDGTPGALLISDTVAKQLASLGWSKAQVQSFLWEESKVPAAELARSGLEEWIDAAAPSAAAAPRDPWPISARPEQLIVCVAGGGHPTNHYWMQADAPAVAGRPVVLPAGWDDLLAEAERDLGPSGEACML